VLAAKRNARAFKRKEKAGGLSAVFILVVARLRISCCRLSRRSRRCWERRAPVTLFFAVTDARPDTGGLSGATPGEKQYHGAKSIPTAYLMRWYVMSIQLWRCDHYGVCFGQTQTARSLSGLRTPRRVHEFAASEI